MIALNSINCEVLGLTFWKLKSTESQIIYTLSREEKELLRKILLAKNIKFTDETLQVYENSIAIITLPNWQLVFDSVEAVNSGQIIHLPKLSVMLKDAEQKKRTWYKLKNLPF
jgi:hypothetical protein